MSRGMHPWPLRRSILHSPIVSMRHRRGTAKEPEKNAGEVSHNGARVHTSPGF
jgi:hypothetical protein